VEGIRDSDAGTPSTTRPGRVTVKASARSALARDLCSLFPGFGETDAIACLRLVTFPPRPPRPLRSVRVCGAASRSRRACWPPSISCHPLLRRLGVIRYCGDATLARAVRAAVERPVRLDPMSDDLAPTVITGRGELVNRAFKTVEGVGRCRRVRRRTRGSTRFRRLSHFVMRLETPRCTKCSGRVGVKPAGIRTPRAAPTGALRGRVVRDDSVRLRALRYSA